MEDEKNETEINETEEVKEQEIVNEAIAETVQPDEEEWMDGLADERIETPKKTSNFRRIKDVFFAPRKLAENIKYHPSIGSAIIFFIIIGLLSAPFIMPATEIVTEATMKSMHERYGDDFMDFYQSMQDMQGVSVSVDGAAATSEEAGGASALGIFSIIGGVIGSVISPLVTIIFSAFLYNLGVKIMGGTMKFGQAYSFILHAACITALGGLLFTISSVLLKTHLNIFSLSIFSDGNLYGLQYQLLNAVNIFTLWYLVVVFIGLREISGISTVKAIILIILGFVISLGVSVLMTKLSTFAMDNSFKMIMQQQQ